MMISQPSLTLLSPTPSALPPVDDAGFAALLLGASLANNAEAPSPLARTAPTTPTRLPNPGPLVPPLPSIVAAAPAPEAIPVTPPADIPAPSPATDADTDAVRASALAAETVMALPALAAVAALIAAPRPAAPLAPRAEDDPVKPDEDVATADSAIAPPLAVPGFVPPTALPPASPIAGEAEAEDTSVAAPAAPPAAIAAPTGVASAVRADDPGAQLVSPAAPPPGAPNAASAIRALDIMSGDAWLDQLARDIVTARQSRDQLSFALTPPSLGRLDVALRTSENGMHITLHAQTADATALIVAAQPRLNDELRASGVRIAATEIATNPNAADAGTRDQPASRERPPPPIETARPRATPDQAPSSPPSPTGRFA